MTGRDGTDHESDLINKALDGLRQAKDHSDQQKLFGDEIMALEEDIKTNEGRS